MSDMFGTPYNRGCFFKLKYDSTDSKGAVLAQGFSNSEISNTTSKGDTVVVVGFSAERQEMMSFVKCFSDKSFIYAFGNDLEKSILSVNMIAFLQGGDLKRIFDSYEKNRLSKLPKPTVFNVGSTSFSGYLFNIRTSTESPEFNLNSVSANFIIKEIA